MKVRTLAAAVLTGMLALAGCNPPQVVQGTVVAVSPDRTTLTLRDELPPHQELVLSLQGAEVGAAPAPGDLVRVALYREGTHLRATRVMNLTRQAELGKRR